MEKIVSTVKNFCRCGCGEEIEQFSKHRREPKIPKRFKHRHYRKVQDGKNNAMWKGGKFFDGYYWFTYNPEHHFAVKRYVRTHRLVYEESRNCCLLPWVGVHHKDADRTNNIWYNLQPYTTAQHTSIHHKCKTISAETRKKISLAGLRRLRNRS